MKPALFLLGVCLTGPLPALGNGVFSNGHGARSLGLGGADVAWPLDPLSALAGNPAGLSLLDAPELSLSLVGVHGSGYFENAYNSRSPLRTQNGAFPELAWAMPLADTPFAFGLAFTVESAKVADWEYWDAPGGVDGKTSYGRQDHRSEFLVLRGAAGFSAEINERLSLGASLGLIYHRSSLDVPFIFQSQPALLGWKTLLDLDVDDFGWNADLGLLYRLTDDLSFGLNYRAPTRLKASGQAEGNVSAQLDSLGGFGGVPPGFRYDAEWEVTLPQMLSAGFSWKPHENLRLSTQVDWIDWSSSYDELRVRLSHGSNSAINGLTKSSTLRDDVPLDWKDRLVYRAGMELNLTEELQFRLGYSYGRSPIPSSLVTPLNAAIAEHGIAAGFGYERGDWRFDLACQYDLPNAVSLGQSRYRSGEYSHSRVQLETLTLALSARCSF